jgi:hypothetical protein
MSESGHAGLFGERVDAKAAEPPSPEFSLIVTSS